MADAVHQMATGVASIDAKTLSPTEKIEAVRAEAELKQTLASKPKDLVVEQPKTLFQQDREMRDLEGDKKAAGLGSMVPEPHA